MTHKIILASGSVSRASLLRNAGITFDVCSVDLDENILKEKGRQENWTTQEIAEQLAIAKARKVSSQYIDAYVIGGDQILECQGRLFDKPKNMEEVKQQLLFLKAQLHFLITSIVIVKNNEVLWKHTDVPKITMRDYTTGFVDNYLKAVGNTALQSVGGCQLEGLGMQLFEKVEGDYFSILGLPILPLIHFLQSQGVLEK